MAHSNEPLRMRPRSKPVAWTLFVSVLLNLFLVGAFIGVVPHVKHKTFGPMALGGPHGEYLVDWMARYLDAKDAAALREAVKGQTDALKQAHSHMHRAMNDLATAYKQDTPDPAALQAALDHLDQAKKESYDAVGKILKETSTELSPEGRQRLADLAQNPM